MDESELPTRAPRSDGPPLPRAWADRDPVAARRLSLARLALGELAEQQGLPVENVLTPDYLRRVLWTPPATRDPKSLRAAVDAALSELGARPWQIALAGPVVTTAILEADQPPPEPEPAEPAEPAEAAEPAD
jgi:ribonuclease D